MLDKPCILSLFATRLINSIKHEHSCKILYLFHFSFAGDGVLICSIDNMPAQMPREATDFFGSLLLPYIPEIVIILLTFKLLYKK